MADRVLAVSIVGGWAKVAKPGPLAVPGVGRSIVRAQQQDRGEESVWESQQCCQGETLQLWFCVRGLFAEAYRLAGDITQYGASCVRTAVFERVLTRHQVAAEDCTQCLDVA